MKVNKKLFPVKAHFFFFMAASGPILPYLTVYGRELGISEVLMGSITAGVPITFLLAKPVFGFVADYFYQKRKLIFMGLIIGMSLFYLGLYFIPPVNIELEYYNFRNNSYINSNFCLYSTAETTNDTFSSKKSVLCRTNCFNELTKTSCQIQGVNATGKFCFEKIKDEDCNWSLIPINCQKKCILQTLENNFIFQTYEFYGFIILMTLSMIAFNVGNSISDAICFDVLGEGHENKYGYQRVWGTIGFGITAFLGGIGMDLWSGEDIKNYKPAFFMVATFTVLDLLCCLKLKLPKIKMSGNILKDLSKVLKDKAIAVFLVFATLVGILDGFIIYFMFWFLEDLATETNQLKHVKVLEGLTVAAETLGGEIIFFVLAGKIIKKLGYGHTLTLCFFNYALRLCLISLISDPWWIVGVELLMQGPTYALCYTNIVAYASAISPPGTSATMQGIVAGMDDGFGYSLGSLIGGFLYKAVGGRLAFQIFSFLAVICCVAHMIMYKTLLSKAYKRGILSEYKPPKEAVKLSNVQDQTIDEVK